MTTRKPVDPAATQQGADAATEAKPKARTLASAVHVDGRWFYAGDSVPADVAKQITNESAWATE